MIPLIPTQTSAVYRMTHWLGKSAYGTAVLALIWVLGDPFNEGSSLD